MFISHVRYHYEQSSLLVWRALLIRFIIMPAFMSSILITPFTIHQYVHSRVYEFFRDL